MNNDLEQFTEERLNNIIELADNPTMASLARIALSAKQAKPIGFVGKSYAMTYFMPPQDSGVEIDDLIYTTPQPAHTEQDDTRRMDWLVSQNVEVRTPMPYGSHARFVAQCDSDDCEEYHTTLREQIDKAMFAAAPKPESE